MNTQSVVKTLVTYFGSNEQVQDFYAEATERHAKEINYGFGQVYLDSDVSAFFKSNPEVLAFFQEMDNEINEGQEVRGTPVTFFKKLMNYWG
jgi:hypothetical protein